MSTFTVTLHKGYQSHRESVLDDELAACLTERTADGWRVENVERQEPIVRFGSEGQPVYYEDEADASEHFLRMAEGWC